MISKPSNGFVPTHVAWSLDLILTVPALNNLTPGNRPSLAPPLLRKTPRLDAGDVQVWAARPGDCVGDTSGSVGRDMHHQQTVSTTA